MPHAFHATNPIVRAFVRWYAHRELPRYGHLLDACGMNDQPAWADAPTVETRDRFHGYRMMLDLADFYQRIAWFFGCYGEMHILSVLSNTLHPGDEFLDGGANIGLVSLHAAGLVGPRGCLHAFEPCNAVLDRLRWHVEANELANVHIHELAISDAEETLELRIPGFGNMASGTLGPIPHRYGPDYHDACQVHAARGDDLLEAEEGAAPHTPLLIKLDVEGFELRALRGLARTIETRRPAILVEINDEMLEMNGATPRELCDFLASRGYLCFALDRCGIRRLHQLRLHLLTREQIPWESDVLWLHPCGSHWPRLRRCFRKPGTYWRHDLYYKAAARGAPLPGVVPIA